MSRGFDRSLASASRKPGSVEHRRHGGVGVDASDVEVHEPLVNRHRQEERQFRTARDRSPEAELVRLVVSGRELMLGAGGAHAAWVVTPEVADEAEAELVGGFVHGFQDWAELWDEIPMTDRLKAELGLTEIKELREAGFVVYCGHRHASLEGGIGGPTAWRETTLCIFRADDPTIAVHEDADETAAPG